MFIIIKYQKLHKFLTFLGVTDFFKHTHVYTVSQVQCGNYGLPL